MQINKLVETLRKYGLKLIIMCLSCLSVSSYAFEQTAEQTFDALSAAKQITTNIHIATQGNIVPKQQVVVEVEVRSLLAFDGDIKVQYFDVENSLIVHPEQPAILTIKEVEGQQWFIQRKTINVYPLIDGTFTIAPLKVDVRVLGEQEKLSGNVQTPTKKFSVVTPDALVGVDNYIVSPDLTFTLSKSEIEQKDSGVGSAVTLTYELMVAEQHALTLPTLTFPDQLNVQMYRKPEEKRDEFERFEKYNTAILEQSVTLIFDDEGKFAVPMQKIPWWNPKTSTLTEQVIEQDVIIIGDGEPDLINFSRTAAKLKNIDISNFNFVQWLYFIVSVVFVIFIIKQTYTNRAALIAQFHRVNQTQSKRVTQQFYADVSAKNYPAAIASLYQLLELSGSSHKRLDDVVGDANKSRIDALKALAFNKSSNEPFTKSDASLIVKAILAFGNDEQVKAQSAFLMKLNPDS
ncbi:hypothetical protein AADZ86_00655 [Colwelliaceae bacterium BS250]